MINFLPKPTRLLLQWHITENCNLSCKHCYQNEEYINNELRLDKLKNILDQYTFLIKNWNIPIGSAKVNITGGEPFLHKDFLALVKILSKNSNKFKWGILSNGTLLTEDLVRILKHNNISSFQVSIEGLEKENDNIRGIGVYKKALNALQLLKKFKIRSYVSFTVARNNFKDIKPLVPILEDLGVNKIGVRRLVPEGSGKELISELQDPLEIHSLYLELINMNKLLKFYKRNIQIDLGCEAGIINEERKPKYRNICGMVDGRILIIMPNGDLLACRRAPIKIGNVLRKSMFELYYSSNVLESIRNIDNSHPFCKKCSNFKNCFGGAKCINYCSTGQIFIPDIQCWRFKNNFKMNMGKSYQKNEGYKNA